ncbi:MAG TPA: PAS domain S-box protein [Flavipsychrobacter sp.]|nr:PAS domain S-box protein [Flavipsychrobacter sp.]
MENFVSPGKSQLNGKIDLYQRMIEEIQDYAILLLDTNGIIQNWNRGAEKIQGYQEDDIIGKHFSIFYLQEDIDTHLPQKLMEEAYGSGRVAQEGWRQRNDGTRFWGSITITALHDDDGNVIGFSEVTRDLTDKKLFEDKLRMSEERYHQMVAEVQDYAIILLSATGVIENWNAGAESIKGYKSEDVLGKNFQIFYPQEDRERGLPEILLTEAREKGKAMHEGWRIRKDGSKFWGTIVITALHNKKGDVIGFSKVTRDLTDKKLSEDKLAAYTAELEVQNSELEQFAYVASHDLQEPLRKIQTFAGLIRERFDDKEFVERYFEKLDASAKRMSELIRSLLNYSRLSKERNELMNESVDLNVILKNVKQDFELMIEEKQAVIVSDPLPTIAGHPLQLGQLFSNLVSNALKFSPSEAKVTLRYSKMPKKQIHDAPYQLNEEYYHCITVEDNGIGFEQQYSKLIFSLFQRLHGKQDYAGTGIGLALCKKIAENHNGFITATSEAGKGAKFSVYLPVSLLA